MPPPKDPNVYLFTVIGEILDTGLVRVWLTDRTIHDLHRYVGELDAPALSSFIVGHLKDAQPHEASPSRAADAAHALCLSSDAYSRLKAVYPGVNDDHSFQLFIESFNKAT